MSSTRPRPRRASKTRQRPRHAGGRPPAFIPTAVVLRAIELYEKHREWTRVLRELAAEGNGSWARNTMIRRATSTAPARVHNSDVDGRRRAPAAAPRGVSKTDRGRGLEALELAVSRAKYGTPAYHIALAALHAALGPCGCYSCGTTRAGHWERAA